MLETGLLLILIPWSAFWERNYFVESIPLLEPILSNAFVRGAISGLGVVNLLAALGELADLFGRWRRGDDAIPQDPEGLGDRRAS